MRLSAPIFRLKKQARTLARTQNIPLHKALNRIAKEEGFENWSLLSARFRLAPTAAKLLARFTPGDLVLLAARPFQGKTTMGLSLVAEAFRSKQPGAFFTLYLTDADIHARLKEFDIEHTGTNDRLVLDTSDKISAPYIIDRMQHAASGTIIVIDYLQILDQRRDTPVLDHQVQMLKAFASKSGAVIVLISQVNRIYETRRKDVPDLSDVHLPNPVDISAFTKTCFLNDGTISFEAAA